jgi:anti-sigma regulatory factor (Ser/Thr protein kinase)
MPKESFHRERVANRAHAATSRGRYRANVTSDGSYSEQRGQSADNAVEVILPLDTHYIATLRLLTASLAADAGFSVDEIDDVRLAISEIWSVMADCATDGRVATTFTNQANSLAATMRLLGANTDASATSTLTLDELGRTILESVVDSYVINGCNVTITKRATEVTSA